MNFDSIGKALRTRGHGIFALVLAEATTCYLAMVRGQDLNWDQMNYHLSSAAEWLTGTSFVDIAPSGIQSYFNPLPLVPTYLLIHLVSPRLVALVLAAVQGLALFAAWPICRRIDGDSGGFLRWATVWLAYILCLLSPVTLSEAGTTLNDVTTTLPMLLAFLLLMIVTDTCQPSPVVGRSYLQATGAGFLLGLAGGLKLTNLVYVLGAAGFFIPGRQTVKWRVSLYVVTGASAVLGFLAIAGFWQTELWRHFGNPFFPYFNGIFHSPDYRAISLRDNRFAPRSALDILLYPYYWFTATSPIVGQGSPSSELQLGDARPLLAFVLCLVPVGWTALRLVGRKVSPAPRGSGVAVAVGLSYLIWLYAFTIQRYAVGVEILCGAVLLYLVSVLRPWLRAIVLAICLVLSARHILVPEYLHQPWGPVWATIRPTTLPRPTLLFLPEKPTAYVKASLPSDTILVGTQDFDLRPGSGTWFARTLAADLNPARGYNPALLLRAAGKPTVPPVLDEYGLHLTDQCVPLDLAQDHFRICYLGH